MRELYQELETKEGTLRGFLHIPNCDDYPLVIMFHGFTGNKIENNFLFVQFARKLSQNHIACLRFDFLGSGDSDLNFEDMTLTKEIEQGEAIFQYAQSLPNVSKIIILGFSMGGVVASHVAKKYKEMVDKLILWAPAGNVKAIADIYEPMKDDMYNGHYDIGGLLMSQRFLDDIKSFDVFGGINIYKRDVAIFHGTDDKAVPLEMGRKYQSIYEKSELFEIINGGHTFRNIKHRLELFDLNIKFILK